MPASLEYIQEPLVMPRRRLHLRQPVTSLAYVDMGEHNGGILLNISEWGLALHAAEILPADRPVSMRFKLPESKVWVKTSGRIVWRSESRKKAGVCFADLSEDVREQIRDWVCVQAPPSEIDARDSQPEAAGPEASQLPDSETAEVADGLAVAAPRTATQAIQRGGFAGLLARIERMFLGKKAPVLDLSAEPLITAGNGNQDDLPDANIQ
ncbi:MAG: PilZ domain-containing protein [Candidatus Acidiferrales bacterium]